MPLSQTDSRALAAIARACVRRPWLVIVAWLAVVVGCFAVDLGVFNRLEPDVGVVPGSDSDRAYAMLAQAGPRPVELTAVMTHQSTIDPALREVVAQAVGDLRRTAPDSPSHTEAARDAVAAIRAIGTPFEVAVGGDVKVARSVLSGVRPVQDPWRGAALFPPCWAAQIPSTSCF